MKLNPTKARTATAATQTIVHNSHRLIGDTVYRTSGSSKSGSDHLQHDCIPLIAIDDAVEALEFVGAFDGHTQFLHFEGSAVPDNSSSHFSLGVIAGKTVFFVDRRRRVVDGIAGRNGDLKYVSITGGFVELNRKFAWLFGLKKAQSLIPQDARANQKQTSSALGVIVGFEAVIESEGQGGLRQIGDAGVGDAKVRERTRQHGLNRFDTIDILTHVAQCPAFGPGAPAQTSLFHTTFEQTAWVQSQLSRPRDAVHVGRLNRKRTQLTPCRSYQKGIAGLQFAANLSKRSDLVRRIEIKQAAKLGMLHNRNQRRIIQAIRQLDRNDGMVETIRLRRRLAGNHAAFHVDHYEK